VERLQASRPVQQPCCRQAWSAPHISSPPHGASFCRRQRGTSAAGEGPLLGTTAAPVPRPAAFGGEGGGRALGGGLELRWAGGAGGGQGLAGGLELRWAGGAGCGRGLAGGLELRWAGVGRARRGSVDAPAAFAVAGGFLDGTATSPAPAAGGGGGARAGARG
jgi:hypothetical protein